MIMEMNFGNDGEPVALIYMTIAGGSGSEAWENARRDEGNECRPYREARPGSTLGRVDPELSNPFAGSQLWVCVCVLCVIYEEATPPHSNRLISLCLSEQRQIINEYLYGSQSCNFLPH